MKRSNKLYFFWIIAALLSASACINEASARWLWVKGDHKGEGCSELRRSLEGQLSSFISELTQNSITFDGQLLTCDSDRCARARLLNGGGVAALFGQSKCINQQLIYEVHLVTIEGKALVYLTTLKPTMTEQDISLKVMKLSEQITKGPRAPRLEDTMQKTNVWDISIGWSLPNVAAYIDGGGSIIKLSYIQRSTTLSKLSMRYDLSYTSTSTRELIRALSRGEVGALYSPTSRGFSPWLGAGVSIGYLQRRLATRTPISLLKTPPEDERSDLNATVLTLKDHTSSVNLSGWVESGVILTQGSLQPSVSTRFHFLNVGEGSAAEVNILFGLRWL
jgi:hypothetical protein